MSVLPFGIVHLSMTSFDRWCVCVCVCGGGGGGGEEAFDQQPVQATRFCTSLNDQMKFEHGDGSLSFRRMKYC